jgi:hypothetical protein
MEESLVWKDLLFVWRSNEKMSTIDKTKGHIDMLFRSLWKIDFLVSDMKNIFVDISVKEDFNLLHTYFCSLVSTDSSLVWSAFDAIYSLLLELSKEKLLLLEDVLVVLDEITGILSQNKLILPTVSEQYFSKIRNR